MCHVTNQKEVLIAEKDIEVYKILHHVKGQLSSPFKYFKYTLNQLYQTEIKSLAKYLITDQTIKILNRIYKDANYTELVTLDSNFFDEGFHTYINYDPKKLCDSYDEHYYKAIIPKGSEYYIDIRRVAMISNQLIILSKV